MLSTAVLWIDEISHAHSEAKLCNILLHLQKKRRKSEKNESSIKNQNPFDFFFLKPTRGHCPLDNFVSTRLRWRSHLKIKNWFWRKSFWFSLWMLTIIIWILKGINLVFKIIYVNNKCEYATWNQLSIIFLPFALSLTSMHQDIDMTIFFFRPSRQR